MKKLKISKKVQVIYGNSWPLFRRVPVLRLLLPFLFGIPLSSYCTSDHLIVLQFIWLPLLIGCGALYWMFKGGYRTRYYFGVLLFFQLAISGFGMGFFFRENLRPEHYTQHKEIDLYLARVVSGLQEKPKSFKCLVEVVAIKDATGWKQSGGKIVVYMRKDSVTQRIAYGESFVFNSKPELISADTGGLSSTLYLHRQIYSRVFLKEIVCAGLNNEISFMSLAIKCRSYISKLLMEQLHHSKEAAIAVALLVGEEISIDAELTAAYAATGTLHVLSVSGMHVGLIFFLLSVIFKPLSEHKIGRHVYFPLVILLIWAYAFVAGAAPSIVRASTMCMFYLLAKWMNRKNQGFGALGASLFIILIINPFNIYEPGLQLSFFAVWGIIWLQRPILRWWTPGNLVLFKLWEMSAVSLAAQIMTIPVSLFYFGQFPNYFMLANMLVIPLTTICIYSCILQLLCTPFKAVMEVIAMINNFLIKLSDIFVLELKDWPGAVSHWQVTMSESIVLYLLIFAIENWCRTRRFQLILWMMFLLILQTLLMIIQIA